MELTQNEIIGEDFYWYERSNQYTARVESTDLRILTISIEDFEDHFGRAKEA
jgi:hypothetical protein